MIAQLYPKDFPRYLSLPVLGPWMDSYAAWLHEKQYTRRSVDTSAHGGSCEWFLEKRGFERIEDIDHHDLQVCYRMFRRKFPNEEGGVHTLTRFLVEKGAVSPLPFPNHAVRTSS